MKILNQSKTVQRIHAKMHAQKLEMELQKKGDLKTLKEK